MFEHVKQVTVGLILAAIYITLTGLVALAIDPFNNGVPWANWLTLAAVSVVCVTFATVASALSSTEGEFWAASGIALVAWLIVGGIVTGMMTSYNGLESVYHSLAWAAWGTTFVALPVATLVHYITAANAERKAGSIHELRRSA